jgi:fermentation-respiration switch protein FrsA (DUF1100 family)
MNAEIHPPTQPPRRSRGSLIGFIVFLVILLGIVVASALLARSRALALVHPERRPVLTTPDDFGISNWEDVSFVTPDGLRLMGWFIPPAPEADGATIIFVHGFGYNRTTKLPHAALLVAQGYGALLYDTRNLGESEGSVSTLGLNEPLDVRGALDYLATRPEVDMARIGIMGESLGGASAIRAAATMPELRAVVAEAAFSSLEENVSEGVRRLTGLPPFPFAPMVLWFAEQEAGGQVGQVRPVDEIAQIAPRPVLLLHGEDDTFIAPANSERLYAAAGEPKQLHIFPDAGHGRFMETNPSEFAEVVVPFFNDALLGDRK